MKTLLATLSLSLLCFTGSLSAQSGGGIQIDIIPNGKITDYDEYTRDGEVTNLDNGEAYSFNSDKVNKTETSYFSTTSSDSDDGDSGNNGNGNSNGNQGNNGNNGNGNGNHGQNNGNGNFHEGDDVYAVVFSIGGRSQVKWVYHKNN